MSLLRKIRHQLDTKALSSVELVEHYLTQIERLNPELNAYISTNKENALSAAKKADEVIASKAQNLLTGIPISHKDNIATNILTTTCGSKILSNYHSPFNATIVDKLQQQNMVLLGKTNMDEFGMGSTNENSYYGSVSNPYSKNHVAGGSSGGSAAAVSAGLTPIATGSDTGGSVRQPASFCGVTGVKPSYGTLSRYGLIAYASSFDQVGVMATSVEDSAYLLQAMAGKDQRDGTSVDSASDFFTQSLLQKNCHGLSIGVDDNLLNQLPQKFQQVMQDTITQFECLGVKIKKIQLPNLQTAVSSYYILAPAEAATNLARFDGVRFGYRSKQANTLDDLYTHSRSEGFGPEVKRRIMIGNYVLAASQYEAYYHKAQQIRMQLSQQLNQIYQQVDMILLPTVASSAFEMGQNKDPVTTYLSDMYTLIANLTGAPAVSFPVNSVDNMPFSAQLMGANFKDFLILHAAHQFQQHTDFHLQTPQQQGVLL